MLPRSRGIHPCAPKTTGTRTFMHSNDESERVPNRSRLGEFLLDHAVIAGRDLDILSDMFADLGMAPEYGGAHAHDVTHNAVIGFDDGSYIELISTVEPEVVPSKRAAFIKGNAGPCGWAVETDDVETTAETIAARNIPVELSDRHERDTPDGKTAAWRLAYLGGGEPGSALPFVIEDYSPRTHRITPSPSVTGTELTGVELIIVGVDDLESSVGLYRRVFDLRVPERQTDTSFGADVAYFPGSAVVLATPRAETWLADRVARFGTLPCGVLVTTTNFEAACDRIDAASYTQWFGRRIGWVDSDTPIGGRVGVIERQ